MSDWNSFQGLVCKSNSGKSFSEGSRGAPISIWNGYAARFARVMNSALPSIFIFYKYLMHLPFSALCMGVCVDVCPRLHGSSGVGQLCTYMRIGCRAFLIILYMRIHQITWRKADIILYWFIFSGNWLIVLGNPNLFHLLYHAMLAAPNCLLIFVRCVF